jgi:hypothetical protein
MAFSIDESQHKAARVVGLAYLLTMATSVFAFYVRSQLVVYNDAAETARNISSHERLFRLAIVGDVITIAGVVALITALYVVLAPVNRNLALFAAFSRMLGAAIGVTALLNDFDVLRALSGAEYLHVFEADRLQVLARMAIGAHGAGSIVDFVFLGLGSTVFAYLWLRSSFIPRALAALGVFSSLLLAMGSLANIVFPDLPDSVTMITMAPLGVFEVTMGFWLALKRLRPAP